METFTSSPATKLSLLLSFHERLSESDFSLFGIGDGDERALLEHFGAVTRSLATLPLAIRAIIKDVCAQMGAGMSDFLTRDMRDGTPDEYTYDKYCHVAAGLVGEGLSALWLASGDETMSNALAPAPSAEVGKFLQKVCHTRHKK